MDRHISALADAIQVGLAFAVLIVATGAVWFLTRPEPNYGLAIPQAPALFETSLQSRISTSDTSMTLVSNSLRGGSSLSGYQCFTIDEGRSDAEFVCGIISGTTVSNLERGIDPSTGTSTTASLKYAHRVGANVKVTDFPVIQRMRHLVNGTDTFPNLLQYDNEVLITSGSPTSSLATKYYVDTVAFSGAPDADEDDKGIGELATASEAAAGTSLGSTLARLILPASLATSTPTASCIFCIPVAASGKIAHAFLDLTQHFSFSSIFATNASTTNATTTNFYASGTVDFSGASVSGITGMYATATAYTSSGTWTKPAGATKVEVFVWGAGGGGAGGERASSANGGGGGGGGCFAYQKYDADDLASAETITVGLGGIGGTGTTSTAEGDNGAAGGDSSFSSAGTLTQANGGGGGDGDGTAGAGGTCSPASGTDTLTQFSLVGTAGGAGGDGASNGSAATGHTALPTSGVGGGGGGGASNSNQIGGAGGANTISTFHADSGFLVQYPGVIHPYEYMLDSAGGTGGSGNGFGGGTPTAGTAGTFPAGGGGGGGGKDIDDGAQKSGDGGNGADGLVIVVTYF